MRMAREFTLGSPFMEFTFDHVPDHWKAILVAWVAFWFVVVIALVYAYAVVFSAIVGFETAVLVGVALIALSVSSD